MFPWKQVQFSVVDCSWILEWHSRYEDLMKELVFKSRKFLLSRAPGGSVIFEQQGGKSGCIEGKHLSDVFRKAFII